MGEGENFSCFCYFFPSAEKPCGITELYFPLLSGTFFFFLLHSKAVKNSESEEK